jgi:hypothetical protein
MIFRFTRIFVAVGLLAGVWLFVTMRPGGSRSGAREARTGPGRVKILQFYASTGSVPLGEKALLCYGVENARSISLSPPVERIAPALSRCVEIAPDHTTHYTLLAEGYDGTVVSQSFTVSVQKATPAPPQILHFAAEREGAAGARLCYSVANASKISLQPGGCATADPKGCCTVTPNRTTTYTLTVFGHAPQQKTSRQVIVEVEGQSGSSTL